MDNGIWKMQQEARLRVATRRAHEHRIAEEQNRRSAAFARTPPPPITPTAPPSPTPPAPKKPEIDSEGLLLLLLALLLAQSGADRYLVLAILYLAI